MSKINGGAAFPQHPSAMTKSERVWGEPGMTLRDWFAGQALARLVSSDSVELPSWAHVAAAAYDAADAMLTARDVQ